MMSYRANFSAAALSTLFALALIATGCGRDESDTSASDTSGQRAQKEADDDSAAAAEGDAAPDAAPAPSAEAPAQTGPIKHVAVAPSADENPVKGAFVFYSAKDKAPALAEFHKKDLESKGWKATRNDVNKLPGTTLGGAIQQFEKGADVLTVIVSEQAGTENTAMVGVMDLPLPPNTLYAIAYGGQMNGEMSLPPADAIAWFTKDLAARGWTADAPKETGGTHSVNFRKGQRTLATQFRAAGAKKEGSTFYFMHMG